jgi:rhamnogalacturonyl hydrolase YesR
MFPPFLVYYPVNNNDTSLFFETTKQIGFYRDPLKLSTGAWAQIKGGKDEEGLWSSANGWAAMGMSRVLATIKYSSLDEIAQLYYIEKLTSWIKKIIDGAKASPVSVTHTQIAL